MNSNLENPQTPVLPDGGSDAQAAYWVALIESERCTEANRRAFALWRAKSDANETAYLSLIDECLLAEMLVDDADVLSLRRRALEPRQTIFERHRTITAIAASLIAALLIWAGIFYNPDVTRNEPTQLATNIDVPEPEITEHHIQTAVGEQITKMLADGSKVVLNTDSEVRIQFTPEKRTLYLLRGQALFDVAHDANRPFIVFANGQRVTALGTQFEVRINSKDVQVLLLEGKVKVDELKVSGEFESAPDLPVKSVELIAGQRFSSLEEKPETVEQEVLENALNWKNGLISYSGQPLEEVISELNRYSVRQIKLADPAIGKLGISGTLRTGSIDRQALYLAAIYDLKLETNAQEQTITINWKQK